MKNILTSVWSIADLKIKGEHCLFQGKQVSLIIIIIIIIIDRNETTMLFVLTKPLDGFSAYSDKQHSADLSSGCNLYPHVIKWLTNDMPLTARHANDGRYTQINQHEKNVLSGKSHDLTF